jgi:hypothetical protein
MKLIIKRQQKQRKILLKEGKLESSKGESY